MRRGGTSTEIAYAYILGMAVADVYGHVPMVATADAPYRLADTEDLAAGDSFFLYLRVGDNDGTDVAVMRGGIRFTSAR